MADFVNNVPWYTVWDAKSGDLLASGTAAMCARRLGYASANSFATGSRTAGSTSSTFASGSSSRAARWTACPANQKGPPVFAARTSPKGDGICKPHHPEE